ncbi:MFS transporter [Streptomyces sp. NPDC052107]|uniref:MFS transporter n=1 Tax=Streptomyces sp. NPDC052107 TaxID=3155632 RepID=UPI0034456B42
MPITVRSAADPAAGESGGHAVAALAAAVVGFFVITLDVTIVNVAVPTIRDELGGGMTGLQWVVDGYTLMFAALLLSAGALSDRVGARRAFGTGMGVFVAASAACGPAPGLGILVAARFVQGAGAAVVMPTTLALIREAYDAPARRARAVAVWATDGAAAAAAGPLVGGVLSELSWRLIFLINIPVGVVALRLVARTRPSPHRRVPFDWAGQVAAVAGMGGLTYGVIEAGVDGFTAPRVIVAFAVAVLGMTGFLAVEARTAHPMVPLEMFRNRTMVIAVTVGFTFMVGFYAAPLWAVAALMVPVGLGGTLVMPPLTAHLPDIVPAHRAGVAGGILNTAVSDADSAFATWATKTAQQAAARVPA